MTGLILLSLKPPVMPLLLPQAASPAQEPSSVVWSALLVVWVAAGFRVKPRLLVCWLVLPVPLPATPLSAWAHAKKRLNF